mmetsp:Transcript_79874/g.166070  ORF Transcript_79874/g.166070 Transcript_79874/m.166070 type:complete len:103 (-) Transcript_79874:102-410(-)
MTSTPGSKPMPPRWPTEGRSSRLLGRLLPTDGLSEAKAAVEESIDDTLEANGKDSPKGGGTEEFEREFEWEFGCEFGFEFAEAHDDDGSKAVGGNGRCCCCC